MGAKKEFLSKTKEKFFTEIKKFQEEFKPSKEISGFGSAPIVGEKNYPNLSIHNISNDSKEASYLNNSNLVKKKYDEVISIKARNILGSMDNFHIKKTDSKILEEVKNIYSSKKAIVFSTEFEKEIRFSKISKNSSLGVLGVKNSLLKIKPNENIQSSKILEKYTFADIKSREALFNLYKKGIFEGQITSLLSLGSFGNLANRKMLPTRWAISAYDSTIEKELYKKIKNYKLISDFELFQYSDKGNIFLIAYLPFPFSSEIIEAFSNNIERDFSGNDNKLNKKEPETAGGYYASKMAIFEDFERRKRQGAFISVRLIEGYDIPLGVVFVRESIREAVSKNNIFKTSNSKEFLNFISSNFQTQYELIKNSRVLKECFNQKRIQDFK